MAEPSQLSHTSVSTTQNASNRKMIVSGNYSFVDRLFPLFEEMLKYTSLPQILYYVLLIFLIFQNIGVSFWPGVEELHKYSSWDGKTVKIILCASMFTDLSQSETSILTRFIIYTVLFLIFLGTSITEYVIYKEARRFPKWSLFMVRFIFEFIPIICLCPLANYAGCILTSFTKTNDYLKILYLIFAIFYYSLFLFIHYIVSKFFNSSPYISTSPNSCWSGDFYFYYITGASLFVFASYLFEFFHLYMIMILIFFKVCFNVFMIYKLLYLPFTHIFMNNVMISFYLADSSLDIYSFCNLAGIKIIYWAEFIVVIGVFIISYVLSIFINKKITKKLLANLKENAFQDIEVTKDAAVPESATNILTNEQCRQHFINLNLHRSVNRTNLYLRLGIANMSDLFLDWSLLKFAYEMHYNAETLCTCAQLISFFPSEIRMLGFLFNRTCDIESLTLSQRFLMYCLNIVKSLRQSASSAEITDKIMSLRRQSLIVSDIVMDFWKSQPNSTNIFYDVQRKSNQVKALFTEAIDRWPNNIKICEDFSSFLIEASTDFVTGIVLKNRANLIEQGKNFVADLSFRSLVRAYPLYLRKGIVDVKGNMLHNQRNYKKGSSSSTASNSELSTGTIDGVLDVEVEEALAKTSFQYHRLRIAYQRALGGRKSEKLGSLILCLVWTFLCFTAMMLFYFIFYYRIFQGREDNMMRQFDINKVRYGLDVALLTSTIHWFAEVDGSGGTKVMTPELFDKMVKHDIVHGTNNIDLQSSLSNETARFIGISSDALSSFMEEVVKMASEGTDIHILIPELADRIVPYIYCSEDDPITVPLNDTLKNVFTRILLLTRELLLQPETTWGPSHHMCEILSNIQQSSTSFNSMSSHFTAQQIQIKEDDEWLMNIFLIIMPIGFILLTAPITYIFLTLTYRDLKKLLILMKDIDENTKAFATEPIKIGQKNAENEAILKEASIGSNAISPCIMYSLAAIPLLIGIAGTIGAPVLCKSANQMFLKFNEWQYLGLVRSNYITEAVTYSLFSIALNEANPNHLLINYVNDQGALYLANRTSALLINYNREILNGGSVESVIGFNSELDTINLKPACVEGEGDLGDLHEKYECSSLNEDINFLRVFVQRVITDHSTVDLSEESIMFDIYHMANTHMLRKTARASELLTGLATDQIHSFRNNLSIICFAFIGGIAIVLVIVGAIFNRLATAYQGAIQLLRRIPPLSISSNQPLMSFVMNRKSQKLNTKMTLSMLVIQMSSDSIVFLSRSESIEFVNSATTTLFGYTPEQILGQSLNALLPQEQCSSVYTQMGLMRNGQSSLNYESSTVAISDVGQNIPLHFTLIGKPDFPGGEQAKSFVLILRDETVLVRQREAAEEAKEKSEKLLFQILPRDIVTRLNRGETDITLTVKSASIIFIDIVKFSDYAGLLQPGQIMENLSVIFAKFDKLAGKYTMITKIKLIGDVYMAAAGLFEPENANPAEHARQMVSFGLDALAAIEEANTLLDASLQVRIGINTGGPIIAGVLGTDKPVFDIIGDTINVASRLQSTCIPMTVQISEGTFELIKDMNFAIEKRGEIELKGKGKKNTFIVRPMSVSSFFGSNSENPSGEEILLK